MLNYFLNHNLVDYCHDQPVDWKDAIQKSAQSLLREGYITEDYVQDIIQCVEKYGPYIVIVPGVAMPHASEESSGVVGTAISFTKFDQPISFFDKETGETKEASLFFTLAAKDPNAHLEHISELMDLLTQDGIIEALQLSQNTEDYKKIIQQFNITD